MNPKISEQQKSKPAYIYVRQSTLAQVRHHQESTERQYALRQKALELGWSEPSTRILDRDLGTSATRVLKSVRPVVWAPDIPKSRSRMRVDGSLQPSSRAFCRSAY